MKKDMKKFLFMAVSGVIIQYLAFLLFPFQRFYFQSHVLFGLFLTTGCVLFLTSFIFLPKSKFHPVIITCTTIGFVCFLLLNIYMSRRKFFIVCQPYYSFDDLVIYINDRLSSYLDTGFPLQKKKYDTITSAFQLKSKSKPFVEVHITPLDLGQHMRGVKMSNPRKVPQTH